MLQFTGNLERFMQHIALDDVRGCWLWNGFLANGYGRFQFRHAKNWYSQVSAHRASWVLHNGDIPVGMFVCHKCDVRHCVNPAHLFIGSAKDNTRDMIEKGRRVAPSTANRQRGDAHTSRTHPENLVRGTEHHAAKITENEVLIIRASKMKGVELARIYGLSNVTVSRIRRRMIWRHVP